MLRKNVASQVVTFTLVNATTGAALTGATVTVKVTLDGTQSGGSGTVTELGTGQYKYVPTQAETNGSSVGFSFTATNAVPVNLHCFTIGQDPAAAQFAANVTQFGGTNATTSGGRPEVNTTHIGGTSQTARDIGASVLLSAGTGTGQLDFTSGVVKSNVTQFGGTNATTASGRPEVNVSHFGGSAGTFTSGKPDVQNVAGNVTGSVGSVTGAVGSVTGAVGSVTGNVGGSVASVTAGVTVSTNNDKTGYSLSAAAIQAIWDALTSALTTASSIGKLLVDNLNATISSRLASASYTAPPSAATVAGAVWDEARASHTTAGSFGQGVASVQGNITGNVAGSIGSIATGGIAAASFAAGAVDASAIAADAIGSSELAATAANEIRDAVFARAFGTDYSSLTFEQLVELMASALAGKLSGAATTTVTIRSLADSKDVIVATVDANGNRTALTLTP